MYYLLTLISCIGTIVLSIIHLRQSSVWCCGNFDTTAGDVMLNNPRLSTRPLLKQGRIIAHPHKCTLSNNLKVMLSVSH
jgi:hypothetical protein